MPVSMTCVIRHRQSQADDAAEILTSR